MEIKNEFYCRDCGHEIETEHAEYECPKCGSHDVFNCRFVECSCGERVYLTHNTNFCPECEKMYNMFGQELAPVDEWDPEDAYACFGPQNAYEY